jgi:Tfp pilus assembly protein PilV
MSTLVRSRGISLLEALVAIAVMAIGAVAVVGMQAGLRLGGDVAKQRLIATRLAQEVLDRARGFESLTATGSLDWTDLVTDTATLTPADSNATFTRTVTVVDSGGAGTDLPRSKTLHVRVTWTDRSNQDQAVDMNTLISGVHPELAGTLGVPQYASPFLRPQGRHPAIPPVAINDGPTSRFVPPGASDTWVFNNATGAIVQICPVSGPCVDVIGKLLSGFIRFATGTAQPTAVDSEAPSSPPLSTVEVTMDNLVPALGADCYEEFAATHVAYFCLIRTSTGTPNWGGKVQLAGLALSSSMADNDPSRFKVCRYTTVRNNTATVPTDLKNTQGPLTYVGVQDPLTNQNFLVIRAGASGVAFTCPNDDTATTRVNGSTWQHQPET